MFAVKRWLDVIIGLTGTLHPFWNELRGFRWANTCSVYCTWYVQAIYVFLCNMSGHVVSNLRFSNGSLIFAMVQRFDHTPNISIIVLWALMSNQDLALLHIFIIRITKKNLGFSSKEFSNQKLHNLFSPFLQQFACNLISLQSQVDIDLFAASARIRVSRVYLHRPEIKKLSPHNFPFNIHELSLQRFLTWAIK